MSGITSSSVQPWEVGSAQWAEEKTDSGRDATFPKSTC